MHSDALGHCINVAAGRIDAPGQLSVPRATLSNTQLNLARGSSTHPPALARLSQLNLPDGVCNETQRRLGRILTIWDSTLM